MALAVALLAVGARADVLHVPGDFASIQAAADAATGGDTILIAADTYDEQVVLVDREDLVFRAQGKVVLEGASMNIAFDLTGCSGITLDGLRFTGITAGVAANDCDGLVIRRCRAEGMDELGFALTACTGLLLDRCLVDGALGQGLQIIDPVGGVVRKCTLRNVNTGADIRGAQALQVDRLRVEHLTDGGVGIRLDGTCTGCVVLKSRTTDTEAEGVLVDGHDNRIERVVVTGAGAFGVRCGSLSARNVLDHVRAIHGGDNPIWLDGGSNEARDCKVTGSPHEGVVCTGSGSHLLQDLRVTATEGKGIVITAFAPRCSLIGNRVSQPEDDGISILGAETTLTANVVTGSAAAGIVVQSTDNVLIGNKAKGSADFDLVDTVLDGNSYVDNVFGTVSLP